MLIYLFHVFSYCCMNQNLSKKSLSPCTCLTCRRQLPHSYYHTFTSLNLTTVVSFQDYQAGMMWQCYRSSTTQPFIIYQKAISLVSTEAEVEARKGNSIFPLFQCEIATVTYDTHCLSTKLMCHTSEFNFHFGWKWPWVARLKWLYDSSVTLPSWGFIAVIISLLCKT
jgi:hypothetical protein